MKWLWLSAVIIAIDQVTKYLISQSLQLYESVSIFTGFNLTRVHNTGAAFSFLRDADGWQRWFFIALSSFISIVIVFWLKNTQDHRRWLSCSLALLLGGAIGNLTDRVLFGYVIDFIDISLPFIPLQLFNPWPAFNVADSAISIGVVMLIVDTFWFDRAFVSTHAGKSVKT